MAELRAGQTSTRVSRATLPGRREPCPEQRGVTYFVWPSSQASDTQPGMKPGSRENHRPIIRRKQTRTLASAKEKGPSFLYSCRSTVLTASWRSLLSSPQLQDALQLEVQG